VTEEIALPRNLSRPATGVYWCALMLAYDSPTGEVPGGQPALRHAMNYEGRSAVSEALDELEGYSLIARVGSTRGQRVFVLVLARKREQSMCPECGVRPLRPHRGARECATCFQTVSRRGWKDELLTTWATLKSREPPVGDWVIARRVHANTRHLGHKAPTMFGYAEDDVPGSGSGDGEGIVQAGVAMGIFPETMLRVAKHARRGDDIGEG
jgi:hypothetical protein